jgi:hypothetical protein
MAYSLRVAEALAELEARVRELERRLAEVYRRQYLLVADVVELVRASGFKVTSPEHLGHLGHLGHLAPLKPPGRRTERW